MYSSEHDSEWEALFGPNEGKTYVRRWQEYRKNRDNQARAEIGVAWDDLVQIKMERAHFNRTTISSDPRHLIRLDRLVEAAEYNLNTVKERHEQKEIDDEEQFRQRHPDLQYHHHNSVILPYTYIDPADEMTWEAMHAPPGPRGTVMDQHHTGLVYDP